MHRFAVPPLLFVVALAIPAAGQDSRDPGSNSRAAESAGTTQEAVQSGKTAASLPGDTGRVQLAPSWIVLSAADLLLSSRPSDPQQDPARTLVQGIAKDLRENERTRDNLVMHQPGMAPGQVRVLNAYSQGVTAEVAALQTRDRVDELQRNFETAFAAGGTGTQLVRLATTTPADLFAVGSVACRWRVERSAADGTTTPEWILELHVVPAGERLQFFEAHHHPDDLDGRSAIEAVLRSFDGAAEPEADDTLRGMLIGGIAGAVAGMLVAMMRKRRLQRAAAQRIQVEDAES